MQSITRLTQLAAANITMLDTARQPPVSVDLEQISQAGAEKDSNATCGRFWMHVCVHTCIWAASFIQIGPSMHACTHKQTEGLDTYPFVCQQ